jgi:hypothetical protein
VTLEPAPLQPDAALEEAVRQRIIDWLNQNYHFGEAERLIENDGVSLTRTGVLDRAALCDLLVHLGEVFKIAINRRALPLRDCDTLRGIVSFVVARLQSAAAPPWQGRTRPPTP